MRKRLSITVLAVALVALIAVGGTLAFYTSEATVTNQITTGSVHITLTEPNFSSATGGTLKLDHVTPGQIIGKDPTITNDGEHDVYVRCKVSSDALTPEQQSELLDGSIRSDLWYHADDGYYYYRNILPCDLAKGNNVTLFTLLTIPSGWDSAMADQSFDVSISAEAIQADDFTPATDSSSNITGWQYTTGGPVVVSANTAA
jgi:SipW-cognate class signal peptide